MTSCLQDLGTFIFMIIIIIFIIITFETRCAAVPQDICRVDCSQDRTVACPLDRSPRASPPAATPSYNM